MRRTALLMKRHGKGSASVPRCAAQHRDHVAPRVLVGGMRADNRRVSVCVRFTRVAERRGACSRSKHQDDELRGRRDGEPEDGRWQAHGDEQTPKHHSQPHPWNGVGAYPSPQISEEGSKRLCKKACKIHIHLPFAPASGISDCRNWHPPRLARRYLLKLQKAG